MQADAPNGTVVVQHSRAKVNSDVPSQGVKRPAPHGAEGQQAPKRRSAHACQTCRARKVRCDITIHGRPCTNCRLDKADCVALASKRGPKPRNANAALAGQQRRDSTCHEARTTTSQTEQSGQSIDPQLRTQLIQQVGHAKPISPPCSTIQLRHGSEAGVGSEQRSQRGGLTPESSLPTAVTEVALGLTFDGDDDDDFNEGNSHGHDGRDGEGSTASRAPGSYSSISPAPISASVAHPGLSTVSVEPNMSSCDCTLPPFIRPLARSLPDEDLAYLARKGALKTPDPEYRDEIIRSFITTVHPFMPVLDLHTFLAAISSNGKSGKISLLLYQAVMFAGLAALAPDTVRRMSFESTKDARQAFFSRARVLHDLSVESESKALFQSLMLMSLWYGGPIDLKATWYYTGLAISLAQHIGLHRNWEGPAAERRLRRRLWWSLYIRDRLIALGTRRPMRIRDDDFEVSMLTLDDFDTDTSEHLRPEYPYFRQAVEEIEHGTALPPMCVELAKLCVCIGHVLASQYTLFGRRSAWTKALMVVPKQDVGPADASQMLERCDKEIAEWHERLTPQIRSLSGQEFSSSGPSTCAGRHWVTMELLRHTLISLLHRPRSLQTVTPVVNPSETSGEAFGIVKDVTTSRAKLKSAARELTRLANAILIREEVRYLPTSGATALLSACLTHLLDLDSPNEDVSDAAMYRFTQLMQVLQELRKIYASADSVMKYLGCVVQRSGINSRYPQMSTLAPEFAAKLSTKQALPANLDHNKSASGAGPSAANTGTLNGSGQIQNLVGMAKRGADQATLSQRGATSHTAGTVCYPRDTDLQSVVSFGDTNLSFQHRDFGTFPDFGGQQSSNIEDNVFGSLSNLDYDLVPGIGILEGQFGSTDPDFWLYFSAGDS